MRIFRLHWGAATLSLMFVAATGQAQSQTAVLQPVVTPLYGGNRVTQRSNARAEIRPLSGAEVVTPDAVAQRRSYWQPFFNVTSTVDTNPLGVGGAVNLVPWVSFYGGTDLNWSSHRSDLSLSYLGGGVLSEKRSDDAPIQQFTFQERLNWRHAGLSFFDQLAYFPEALSPFYLQTGGDLYRTNNTSPQLQQAFLPNQSITTTLGQELTNSFASEFDVSISATSSLTFLGTYSLLRFFSNNLLDLNDAIAQAGFNRQITRNNTAAVLYRFEAFRFGNVYQPMDGHVMQFVFGRRVTQHLAFQAGAGPELAVFRAETQPSVGMTAITSFKELHWTVNSSMTYRLGRAALKLGYDHGLTDGAGFLAGAVSDQSYGSIDRRLRRRFTGEIVGGYASNRALVTAPRQGTNQSYKDWFTGVTVSHAWSRGASIFLSYQVQRQASNFLCVAAGCGNEFTRHLLSLGLTSRSQPHPIG